MLKFDDQESVPHFNRALGIGCKFCYILSIGRTLVK